MKVDINLKKTLTFSLFKYFPHGGMQRDMLSIAQACQRRGYKILICTSAWEGNVPEGLELYIRPCKGLTNHKRMRRYHECLRGLLDAREFACVVGFNKIPNLDIYFAADSCFEEYAQRKLPLFRMTGRYRTYAEFEASVFAPESPTEIMLAAEAQKESYQKNYRTPSKRMHLLPPWIGPDREIIEDKSRVRRKVRESLHVSPEEVLLLQVGSGFKTKGTDRTLRALASLPSTLASHTRLAVVGRGSSGAYQRLSDKLGMKEKVMFLGWREDVMELMVGADLLIHPARNEAAGVVIIEALVSGLPVICSGACGHGRHVRKAGAGCVLPEPFQQFQLNQCLLDMLQRRKLPSYSASALSYAQSLNPSGMPERAADIIESVVFKKGR